MAYDGEVQAGQIAFFHRSDDAYLKSCFCVAEHSNCNFVKEGRPYLLIRKSIDLDERFAAAPRSMWLASPIANYGEGLEHFPWLTEMSLAHKEIGDVSIHDRSFVRLDVAFMASAVQLDIMCDEHNVPYNYSGVMRPFDPVERAVKIFEEMHSAPDRRLFDCWSRMCQSSSRIRKSLVSAGLDEL